MALHIFFIVVLKSLEESVLIVQNDIKYIQFCENALTLPRLRVWNNSGSLNLNIK